MRHFSVHFQPDDLTISIHEGATLFEAAEQAGIILSNPCGGQGRCGRCKVLLLPEKKPVLACHYHVHSDLEISVPNSSRFFRQQILEHGISHSAEIDPSIKKISLSGPFTGPDDFCKILSSKLSDQLIIQDQINLLLDQYDWQCTNGITAVIARGPSHTVSPETPCWLLKTLEPGDTSDRLYGLAVDIGTTTVVARLLNLSTSEVLATAACGNPQTKFGADVISRITHAENEKGLLELHKTIVSCLNELTDQACDASGIAANDIYELVAVGNTTMNHLLLKHPVKQLGQAPYRAYSLVEAYRHPSELNIGINPAGNVYTLPNIAGFVGSDTVAAALACQMEDAKEITLLVDIGTNGEIVLAAGKELIAASCAAGPALEGAGIEFGSRAQSGAIERVLFAGDQIDVDVIGQAQASSICGSALIDVAAVLLQAQVIDSTGRFFEPDELNACMPKPIRNRIINIKDMPAFVITGDFDGSQWQNAIYITQKDVRQLQLAKAAIRAGIQMLLQQAGLEPSDIAKLLLAGAFGNYIQKESALRIGLLPQIPHERIHFVGNAAGTGAEMALISRKHRQKAVKLAHTIKYIEIAHQTEFQSIFSDSLMFPEK